MVKKEFIGIRVKDKETQKIQNIEEIKRLKMQIDSYEQENEILDMEMEFLNKKMVGDK